MNDCEQCKKYREAIDFHVGRAFELIGEGKGASALAELDTLLAVWTLPSMRGRLDIEVEEQMQLDKPSKI